MLNFTDIFGQPQTAIRPTCILAPFIPADMLKLLRIKDFKKGFPYRSGNNENLTVIETRVGSSFAGDAVLWLKDTACKNIILFGSCGAVNDNDELAVGALVAPHTSYAFESFTQLLSGMHMPAEVRSADDALLKKLMSAAAQKTVALHRGTTATFASLALQPSYQQLLSQQNIDTIEMESSAVFAAAKKNLCAAVALLYVTDSMNVSHPLEKQTASTKKAIAEAIETGCTLLTTFVKDL